MAPTSVLTVVLLIAGIAACATAIWAFIRIGTASRSAQALVAELEARLVPLAEKTDVTVDAMNAELLRVDAIVSQVEEVTDRVSSATNTINSLVNVPAGAVNELSDRLRRALVNAKKTREQAREAREAEHEHAPTVEDSSEQYVESACEPRGGQTGES